MRNIEVNLYKFNELSEDAKQKALEKLWDINVDNDWWDSIYEDAAMVKLKINGFDIGRGSYVQTQFTEDAHATARAIQKEHGEQCDTYKAATEFLASYDKLVEKHYDGKDFSRVAEENEYDFDNEADELEGEFLNTISECYLKLLRDEYEYRISKEAVIDTIEANEYEFTEDGKMY